MISTGVSFSEEFDGMLIVRCMWLCTNHFNLVNTSVVKGAGGSGDMISYRRIASLDVSRPPCGHIGCVAVWLRGCVAGWLCGCVAMWLRGYVAMWLCGYVAMWLCGYVAVWL